MPGTKAGSSANSILGLRTTGQCLSYRSRISPLIAGCPWRGRSRPTRNTASSACVAAARRRRRGRITEGRWPSERDQSVWFGEHGAEEFFGALQPLLGEHDGFGLVHRVADQALLVEPVQRIPIKPLPGAPVVMAGQKEERQHRVVDLVRVERHPRTLPDLRKLRWGSWPHAYPGDLAQFLDVLSAPVVGTTIQTPFHRLSPAECQSDVVWTRSQGPRTKVYDP